MLFRPFKLYRHKSKKRRECFQNQCSRHPHVTKRGAVKLEIVPYRPAPWSVTLLLSRFTVQKLQRRNVPSSQLKCPVETQVRELPWSTSQGVPVPISSVWLSDSIVCPRPEWGRALPSPGHRTRTLLSVIANSANALKSCFCLYPGAFCWENVNLPATSVLDDQNPLCSSWLKDRPTIKWYCQGRVIKFIFSQFKNIVDMNT